jgi:hypothetical protein
VQTTRRDLPSLGNRSPISRETGIKCQPASSAEASRADVNLTGLGDLAIRADIKRVKLLIKLYCNRAIASAPLARKRVQLSPVNDTAMEKSIQPILDKALDGERLTAEDCTALLESKDFVRIGLAAHEMRMRKNPTDVVTYIIDRNINYTNVCNVVCTFCAFYRRPGKPDTYVHSIEEIEKRIDETIALGGTGVLMQGGLHPDFNIEWYEDLLRTLKAKYPTFQLHCFSPPEIHNISLISKLDYVTIMQRL